MTVDVENRKAYVGGGARWKAVDDATIPHGLASVGFAISSHMNELKARRLAVLLMTLVLEGKPIYTE